MTMSKIWIETIRRVEDEDGGFLEIGNCPEAPKSFLVLRTVEGEKSLGYFGSLNLNMSPDLARGIAVALIAAADEMQKK